MWYMKIRLGNLGHLCHTNGGVLEKKIVVLTPQNVKIDTQKVDGKRKKNYIKLRVPIIDSLCQKI